jgi:hypothetical protein
MFHDLIVPVPRLMQYPVVAAGSLKPQIGATIAA